MFVGCMVLSHSRTCCRSFEYNIYRERKKKTWVKGWYFVNVSSVVRSVVSGVFQIAEGGQKGQSRTNSTKYDKEKQKEKKNEEEKRTYQVNEKRIETTHQIGWQNNKVHNDIETKTTG